MNYLTMTLKKELSLVVLAIDDFTDRVITGSGIRMVTEEGGKRSIRKADGYHVFCDLPAQEITICVEGPMYQKQQIRVKPDGGKQIVRVRMIPGPAYPIPGGTTCVRGKAEPGTELRFYFPDPKKSCKLLRDYDPEKHKDRMGLFRPSGIFPEGKRMCICARKGKAEFFRVLDREEEECVLEHPLSQAYRKIGTSVYPVYETKAGEDGRFYLYLRGLTGEECSCVMQIIRGEAPPEERPLSLKAGRENRLDL